jgi:hypothetical protein
LRHTISKFSSVNFGGLFAFKQLLVGWDAVGVLACWWLILIIITAYWYRIAEASACALTTTESEVNPNPRGPETLKHLTHKYA